MKKVKILIPSYNSEKTIGDTLKSLLAQTYKNIDILVVDNCSSDKTKEIVESFSDERVSYMCNEKNLGNYGNFDQCIKLAEHDYTAIFHSDDIYMPTIVEEQVKVLDSDPRVGIVFTEAEKINNDLRIIGHVNTPFLIQGKTINGIVHLNFDQLLKAIIHHNGFLMCPSAMVRSKIYKDEILKTRIEIFGAAADIDVWLRIAKNWSTAIIKKKLMKYRISPTQHTYRINQKRFVRSEYALIANYYRIHFKEVLKNSNLSIKRQKVIDLMIRLDATKKNSNRYLKYRKIILSNCFDLRLFWSLSWWKYFLRFFMTQMRWEKG